MGSNTVETYVVTYFVNQNFRGKSLDGYQRSDVIKDALNIEVVADTPHGAAEQAFGLLQRLYGDRPSERLLDEAEAPSMSVGDVVLIGVPGGAHTWMSVARFGFDIIEAPSTSSWRLDV
jgi:hypothetical protein